MTDVFNNLKAMAASVKPPVLAVREFASALTEQADGTLQGRADVAGAGHAGQVDLDVIVPGLNNYRLTLLSVSHEISLYPAHVSSHLTPDHGPVAADDYDSLVKVLEEFLSDKRLTSPLVSLIAQVSHR